MKTNYSADFIKLRVSHFSAFPHSVLFISIHAIICNPFLPYEFLHVIVTREKSNFRCVFN